MKSGSTNEGMRKFWENNAELIAYKKIKWGKKSFADTILPLLESKKVLDIGCGSGALTYYLAPHCESIVGIDFSDKMLELARKNSSLYYLDNVNFIVGNILEDDMNLQMKFDVICGTAIIHEFPASDYDKIVKFIKSNLAEDGFCVFQENSFFNPVFRFVRNKLLGRFGLRKLGSEFETPFDEERFNLLSNNFTYVSRVCDTFILFHRFYYQFICYRLKKYNVKIANTLGKMARDIDQLIHNLIGNCSFTRYWSYINTVYISDYGSYEDRFTKN